MTALHRLLVIASPLAFVAFVLPRRVARRASVVQGAVLGLVTIAVYLAISADTPTFWPIVMGTCVLAILPLPGRPKPSAALLLPIVLVATTALTHAVFFGDDRYHLVVTPALCLLAASALRPPSESGSTRKCAHTSGFTLPRHAN